MKKAPPKKSTGAINKLKASLMKQATKFKSTSKG